MEWRRVKLNALIVLTDRVKPELRWKWEKQEEHGRGHLFLRTPRGALWEFKLKGGAWLRPSQEEHHESRT